MGQYEVSNLLVHGTTNLTTVNTPSQVISRTDISPKRGVRLKAGLANSGNVFIGNVSVGHDAATALCGYPLDAGEELFLECEDPTIIYANNSSANDVIHWVIT